MRLLFLDDMRDPIDGRPWRVVRSHAEFVSAIQQDGVPDVISFDHDLDPRHYGHLTHPIPYDDFEVPTGRNSAKWLIDNLGSLQMPRVVVHSWNRAGAENILKLFGLPMSEHHPHGDSVAAI
jgi:hypothetical protein